MKRSVMQTVLLLAVLCLMAPWTARAAQDVKADIPPLNPTIKGNMDIVFASRTATDDKGQPAADVWDTYTMNMTIDKTLMFGGQIKYKPTLFSSMIGREKQSAELDYGIDLTIANPSNLTQKARIGRLVGKVPIDKKGVYHYDKGTLRLAVDATGKVPEHEAKFLGTSAGRPPDNDSALAKAKKQAITLTKSVNGKTATIAVTKYDQISLDMVMAGGPVSAYPDTHVSGQMLYDYERFAWYFRGVTMSYTKDGQTFTDKLTGNIKWVQAEDYATSGDGHYEFDVRVNEPEATVTESAAFAPADNEATFFESDANLQALNGTWTYKDTLVNNPNSKNDDDKQITTASNVKIDMVGNKLTKVQTVNLAKLIGFVGVVQMNSD